MKRKCLLLVALLLVVVPLSGKATGGVVACLRQCNLDNPCDPGDQGCAAFVHEICQCQCQGICP
jgi:hypothetical protein